MNLYICVLIVRECRNWNYIFFKFARYVVTYLDTALSQISDINGIFNATLLPTFMIYLSIIFHLPSFVIITRQQIGNSMAISCN